MTTPLHGSKLPIYVGYIFEILERMPFLRSYTNPHSYNLCRVLLVYRRVGELGRKYLFFLHSLDHVSSCSS